MLQDNAKPHTSKKQIGKIEIIKELESVELLPDPAYSSELAPPDYHFFRPMAHFFKGNTLNNLDEVETGCQDCFRTKDKEWNCRGMEQLIDRLLNTIDFNGLYFEI